MDKSKLTELLIGVAEGRLMPQDAAEALASFPYDDIGIAKIDTHRGLRTGHAEVIFGLGKTPGQVASIMSRMSESSKLIIATKSNAEQFSAAKKALSGIHGMTVRTVEFEEASEADFFERKLFSAAEPRFTYFETARMLVFDGGEGKSGNIGYAAASGTDGSGISDACGEGCATDLGVGERLSAERASGRVCVACGGTADIPIAEEAATTLALYGATVMRHYDVGVAGIHRLLSKVDEIRKTDVIIVVAGMEGALASAIGGLVSVPVIAVPTSVGYGVSMGGLAALFSMLNSCSLGVSVMNIDNGFGAGHFASLILKV